MLPMIPARGAEAAPLAVSWLDAMVSFVLAGRSVGARTFQYF